MNKKLVLTSLIAMGFVTPAMAINNSDTFPDASQGEYMQEDTRYINAATSTNMDGVYEGEVNADAQYENITYYLNPGYYLSKEPDGSENVNSTGVLCDVNGYYCPGTPEGVYYSSTENQGLTQCPNGYGNSDAGASADTDCYRQCSGNVTIEHATGVTGNDYYGNGTDTCEPTGCVNGWHKKNGLNLSTTIGTSVGENSAYINNGGSFSEQNYDGKGAKGQSYYGLTDNNTWAVDYGTNGMLTGQARCSTQAGDNNGYTWTDPTITANLADETGQEGAQYCYCNVTGYRSASGEALQSLSSSWVFDDASNCASDCARHCAYYMRRSGSAYLAFRAALLGSVGASPASCEANTITINWNGTTQAAIDANNAGVATYGGDVRTPQSATPVPGKRFTGWRFSAPTPTSVDPQGE